MSTVRFLLCVLGCLATMLTSCLAPANQKTTERQDEDAMQIVKQPEEDEYAMLPKFVRLVAEDVRLLRECNSGKALLSEPDYVKVPICDKCHAGETFLARPLPQGQSLPQGAGGRDIHLQCLRERTPSH